MPNHSVGGSFINVGRRIGAYAAISGVLLAGFATACSDDDATPVTVTGTDAGKEGGTGTDSSIPVDSSPPSDIALSLAVTYAGAKKGPVLASLWPTAMGPRAGGFPSGAGSNEAPTLPGTNTIAFKNVKPGHYFVFSYVMVGFEHRMGPVPGDPTNRTAAEVDVVAGTTANGAVTLDVEVPGPQDGGADAPADG